MADSNESNDAMDNGSDVTTITEAQHNTVTKGNQRGKVLKRKRGMQKMIIIGTRVSGKYGELVQNPKGPQFRRVRDWVLGNVTKSISNNKYEVKFDNRVVKECSSQALRIEEATSGIPIEETVLPQISEDSNDGEESDDEEESAYIPDNEEANDESSDEPNDFLFPMDSAGVDHPLDDSDKEDECVNSQDSLEFNVGDINAAADTNQINTNVNEPVLNETPLTYHQKLESKRKDIHALIGNKVTKEQNKIKITWTVVEESIPEKDESLAEIRDELSNKLGLKNLLEFMYEFGYDDSNSRGSCSFNSCTSSNIDRKVSSLNESTIFVELFLKLSYKHWLSKLEKMNRHVEETNTKNPKRPTKMFTPSEFLVGHAIIIGAACYSQSGAALFTAGKEEDDTWDSISPKARFERYMKLYRFKEFRHFYPKIFEQPLEMSAWRPRTSKNGGLKEAGAIRD